MHTPDHLLMHAPLTLALTNAEWVLIVLGSAFVLLIAGVSYLLVAFPINVKDGQGPGRLIRRFYRCCLALLSVFVVLAVLGGVFNRQVGSFMSTVFQTSSSPRP